MVIGGVAIIARGVRRLTTDVDACVRGDAIEIPALLAALGAAGITPRVADAVAFARKNLVVLVRHRETGVDLDISLAWSVFEHEALAGAEVAPFGRVDVPMATAEDLVVFKAVAARPKDLEDAAALLALHADIDLVRVRAQVAAVAQLADEPAMVATLDQAITTARRAVKPRGRPPKRR